MQMTPAEIVSSFRRATNKKEQVGILAELNACDKETICEVLRRQGVDPKLIPDFTKKVIVVENQDKKGGSKMARLAAKTVPEAVQEAPEAKQVETSTQEKEVVPQAVIEVVNAEIARLNVAIHEMEVKRAELEAFIQSVE